MIEEPDGGISVPKSLVIVESPAKAKTINKFLGSDFEVTASMGHIRDLPTRELGVDVDKEFEPTYVSTPDKEKTINQLKKLAKKCDTIYLAPDPDREGEAISWHLAEVLQSKSKDIQIHRVTFNEITKQAVRNAIENPSDIDMALVNAQQARRILDRLVGYKISPMLTRQVTRNNQSLSAGRVQSVALRLICEREDKIRAFKPIEYWTVHGTFKNKDGVTLKAELYNVDGQRISHQGESKEKDDKKCLHLQTEDQVKELVEAIQQASYSISKIESKKRTRKALPPYITSTLQQDASRILRFTGDRTMRAAQGLYEGVDIGDETVGLITYMRTDSVRVANEAIESGREFITSQFGDEYIPKEPNVYKTKKSAQDAHEAVRPTVLDEDHAPDKIKKHLSTDQYKIYDLIWKRFLASQMTPAKYLSTAIHITDDRFTFRATGSILTFDGFTRIYRDPDDEKDQRLPKMDEGEALPLDDIATDQHFTKPPPRYNDASLIRELEGEGIGRPSTYASIVKTIVDRNYIDRKENRFNPTDLGEIVSKLLVANFPDIIEVGFTSDIESKLDRVEEGEVDWITILKQFYVPFAKDLTNASKGIGETLRSLQEETDKICQKCQSPMLKKWGRTSWFLACSAYPDCEYTESLNEAEFVETDIECDKCGKMMIVRQGKFGPFLGCPSYPDCKNIKALPTGIQCPKPDCDGDVVQRWSKRRLPFYGCSKYPDCDFVSWDPPVEEKCPDCGNDFLVFKDYKRKGPTLKCPQKGCKYSRPTENGTPLKEFVAKKKEPDDGDSSEKSEPANGESSEQKQD